MHFSKNIIWSPIDYAAVSVLAKEVGKDMLSRLEWLTLKPNVIVDMGCGTGEMSVHLQKHYPYAQVIGLDLSTAMLDYAKQHTDLSSYACADGTVLPLRNQTVDFIFAHFFLPWHTHLNLLLKEWRRVLRPNGLLMFTAFGPDTLREWQPYFKEEEMPQRTDMHDVGDLLLQTGFADPVLDVHYYTLCYREKKRFFDELQTTGMWFPQEAIHAQQVMDSLSMPSDNSLEAVYEVITAHAFMPDKNNHDDADGTFRIPLATLRQQLGNN